MTFWEMYLLFFTSMIDVGDYIIVTIFNSFCVSYSWNPIYLGHQESVVNFSFSFKMSPLSTQECLSQI